MSLVNFEVSEFHFCINFVFSVSGNLSGESNEAYWNSADFTLNMLQGCMQVGASPELDWDIEMTPVDFVSRIIVTLTQRMALGLGKVYHLVNTATIKSKYV